MGDSFERLRTGIADRYLLDKEIGRGGMATVYLAHDLRHQRDVAVKVLRPELAEAVGAERFLREIQTTARLIHPNILPLHDSGDVDGLLYYVMPYVPGETLRERLQREGPLPLADALRIAGEVADALAYAHSQNVVHRDVKPGNILLAGGHAMVADFGLAKALSGTSGEEPLSHTGFAVGTPEYMSPEQASGDAHLDGRTDVYALGCVLYEMLTGEPPFRGTTPHAVFARHRAESIPSVRVVRPDLPAGLDAVVRRALAKVPADRFGSAAEFGATLAAGGTPERRPWHRYVPHLAALAGVIVLFVGWRTMRSRHPEPDPNKVVVFPLVERGTAVAEGTGQEVALLIGSALEHTEPLRWIDGWTWLDAARRGNASLTTASDARRIARDRAARWYVDGSVVAGPESSRVVLRLNDAMGDSLVAQATAVGPAAGAFIPQLGLRAMNELLPRLLASGRRVDLSMFSARSPAAVANWLQGEREYRRGRFGEALNHARRAIEADSVLAVAALRGAQAAEWEHEYEQAAALVELALQQDSVLPTKYRHYARGLRDYYAGHADSAVMHVDEALRLDSTWAEAWASLGEVRYHLYANAESLATAAFSRAHRLEPEFAPPLFHLAELALRRRDTTEAARLVAAFHRIDPDSAWMAQLDLTMLCVRHGPGAINWDSVVSRYPLEVIMAAKVLASQGAHLPCAEAGFRAVLADPGASESARWGGVMGLQGLLTMRQQMDAVKRLLDSAVASGVMAAKGLYVVHAAAGMGLDEQAAQVIAELAGDYTKMGAARLWYHGIWLARRADTAGLRAVAIALGARAAATADQFTRSTERGIAARLTLLEGDTIRAVALLREVVPAGDSRHIEWGVQEPFGAERLLLAQLLLARGEPGPSIEAAMHLDGPRPIIYLMFLRESLLVRLRAAERLGRSALATEYRERLTRLQQ
jgi:serine/threonine-protein kinase